MKLYEDSRVKVGDVVRDTFPPNLNPTYPNFGTGRVVKTDVIGAEVMWEDGVTRWMGFHWIEYAHQSVRRGADGLPDISDIPEL